MTLTVALAGNPNSGKTTMFNALTGANQSVGNYPRVTVAPGSREIRHGAWTIRVVDLPGSYSLSSQSLEERSARDALHFDPPDIVVNVVDAGNLDRSLFLTTQLIEMGRPCIYAFNMIDEARRKGILLDTKAIASMLGGPVVETNAVSGEGLPALLEAIVAAATMTFGEPIKIPYDDHLERAISMVQSLIAELHPSELSLRHSRWLAIKLLEGDEEILRREADHPHLMEMVRRERYDFSRRHGEDSDTMLAHARYGFIHGLLEETRTQSSDPTRRDDVTKRLDAILLHRVYSLPLLLAALWTMFEATFTLGVYPTQWITAGVVWLKEVVSGFMHAGPLRDIIVDGVIAGMGGTLAFLPNIVLLFFFLALFSETGYLARTAFLVDRVMHPFGLHGKAFIPMVMGFGCNVPAIMATRTIENAHSKLVTILISPFMACSARLPVLILFAGAFFADWAGTVVFGMYMASIMVSMGAAVLVGKFVASGGSEAFTMELPPYRVPTVRAVWFHMWESASSFLQKVGGVILVGSVVIWFLQAFPTDTVNTPQFDARVTTANAQPDSQDRTDALAKIDDERSQDRLINSYLGRSGQAIAPLFSPLGFDWRDTVAILTGVVAKEVVVASYAVLYSQSREGEKTGLKTALASAMAPVQAIAFMIFILFYSPCLSTIAVIGRESGSWRWSGFSIVFSFALAWSLAWSIIMVGRIIA